MNELQVPTHGVGVEVATDNGEWLTGHLFLADSCFPAGPEQDLLRLLNDERQFLPFQSHGEDDHPIALNKDHILRVRRLGGSAVEAVAKDEDLPTLTATEPASVFVLADGSQVEGAVAVDTPQAASRTLDKLNHTDRFIPIVVDGEVEFVQRSHVIRTG